MQFEIEKQKISIHITGETHISSWVIHEHTQTEDKILRNAKVNPNEYYELWKNLTVFISSRIELQY